MNRIFSTALLLGTICAGPVLAQTTTTPSPAAMPPNGTMAPAAATATTPPAATMAPATATATTTPPSTMPPAVTTNAVNNTPGAPIAGANSFTMAQAQTRLKNQGFTQVSELMKDDKSIWRGHAMKDGKSVGVAVDYQGNITTD
jgi:hypothetical protein